MSSCISNCRTPTPSSKSGSRSAPGRCRRPIAGCRRNGCGCSARNGFKNEILGTVAHDLKNPLGVILGRTEMLTELIGAGASKDSINLQIEHIRDASRRTDVDGR
ncbi:MAG: hypothetical protein MZV49_20370 [Rhodopseudomonas palustris]|nr:hypothetical protein [Rhodopseudomonas palustris]